MDCSYVDNSLIHCTGSIGEWEIIMTNLKQNSDEHKLIYILCEYIFSIFSFLGELFL